MLRISFSSSLALLRSRSHSATASDVATPRLLYCVQRVDDLLRRRAYIHWYERFGVDAEDMRAAAEALLDTVDAYAEARAAL